MYIEIQIGTRHDLSVGFFIGPIATDFLIIPISHDLVASTCVEATVRTTAE